MDPTGLDVVMFVLTAGCAAVTGLYGWRIWKRVGSVGHLPYMSFFLTLAAMTFAGKPFLQMLLEANGYHPDIAHALELVIIFFLLLAGWRIYAIATGRRPGRR